LDEFGRFARLSGMFPSVFVQAIWVAVDLTNKKRWLDGLLEGEKKENPRKKKGKNPNIRERKKKQKTLEPTHLITTRTLIHHPPLFSSFLQPSELNSTRSRHLSHRPHLSTRPADPESTFEIEVDIDVEVPPGADLEMTTPFPFSSISVSTTRGRFRCQSGVTPHANANGHVRVGARIQ
jgi:hypothetical protein